MWCMLPLDRSMHVVHSLPIEPLIPPGEEAARHGETTMHTRFLTPIDYAALALVGGAYLAICFGVLRAVIWLAGGAA